MSRGTEFDQVQIQAEDLFKEATFEEFFGNYLFELVERTYYRFSSEETGDSVWLIPRRSQDQGQEQEYEPLKVESVRKFPPNQIVPGLCSFEHCEPIDGTLIEDSRVRDIEAKLRNGGKTLACKANRAFVEVLLASVTDETKVEVQDEELDEILADVFSESVSEGFRPDRFLFPEHLEAKLVQQGLIVRDKEIQNTHYVGKTITGQRAFWSKELPHDMAIVFDSTAGVTLSGTSRFRVGRLGPFLPGVCGYLELNPIVKNTKAVIALDGVGQAARRKSTEEIPLVQTTESTFVDLGRIEELQAITSSNFDLSKLIRLCEELNICYANDCFLSVAMLGRAILDHVPPIFGLAKFSEVANNYRGAKSFKKSMEHLENSLRNIADHHLHVRIRNKESLPTGTQVNFSADLDVLLAEIVRLLK